MTDIPKELIEAVRSGTADDIEAAIARSVLTGYQFFSMEALLPQVIVAERETRPVPKTVMEGDVLSDVLIPCDCTPFSSQCRRLRRMCSRDDGVETTTRLQDIAKLVDEMFDETEATYE